MLQLENLATLIANITLHRTTVYIATTHCSTLAYYALYYGHTTGQMLFGLRFVNMLLRLHYDYTTLHYVTFFCPLP